MSYAKAKGNTVLVSGQPKFLVLSQGDSSSAPFTEPPLVNQVAPGYGHSGLEDSINGIHDPSASMGQGL